MSQHKDLFERLDTDGNGTISKEELKSGLSELGMNIDDSKIDSFFSMVDIDGDGEISYPEFTAFVSTHNPDNAEFVKIFEGLNRSLPMMKKVSKMSQSSTLDRRVNYVNFSLFD